MIFDLNSPAATIRLFVAMLEKVTGKSAWVWHEAWRLMHYQNDLDRITKGVKNNFIYMWWN